VKYTIGKGKEVKDWGTMDFVEYFKVKYQEELKIKSHKPDGMLKAYINQKSMVFLWQQGKADFPEKAPSELYKEFVDWIFINKKSKEDGLVKLWMFGNKGIMTDFLDVKSKEKSEQVLGGSLEEFRKAEAETIRKAQEFFAQRKKEKEAGDGKTKSQ